MRKSTLLAAGLVANLLVCGAAAAHDAGHYALDFRQAPPGTLAWGQLAKVGIVIGDSAASPNFLPPLRAMEGKSVVLYGYMTAKPGQLRQKRFLLSPRPIFCSGCAPVGRQEVVEVVLDRPMPVQQAPLAVQGKLALLANDPQGLLFRLERASMRPRTRHLDH
ncbi:MAG TPA: hypothetical protein VLJ57_20935 [Burkholderiaceae bacterium]|nr:hypothetical protein [Burkholderiaceae bacterium]